MVNHGMTLDQYVKESNFQGWKTAPFPEDHVHRVLNERPGKSRSHTSLPCLSEEQCAGANLPWLLLLIKYSHH